MPGKKIAVDKKLIAASLDRVMTDAQFHKELNEAPIEALSNIGIQLPTKTLNMLKGKSLSEVTTLGIGARANASVSVSVDVTVDVVVQVASQDSPLTKDRSIKPQHRVKFANKIQKRVDIANKKIP